MREDFVAEVVSMGPEELNLQERGVLTEYVSAYQLNLSLKSIMTLYYSSPYYVQCWLVSWTKNDVIVVLENKTERSKWTNSVSAIGSNQMFCNFVS